MVVAALRADDASAAHDAADLIEAKSPVSVSVALEAVRRCFELSVTQRSLVKPYATWRINAVIVKIWVGAKDEALADLAELVREPTNTLFIGGTLSVHVLRTNPLFGPLRRDPRFEALLADPKNHAPLF